ncbi:MAG: hypothetical protein CMQ61_01920 [Gammaproteobacteria bacterium]|nr:hypothetical protein [Gammaproteobacteria bacterium]
MTDSEWCLEPHSQRPGTHSHAGDDTFHVIEGTMRFLVDDQWVDAPTRSFVVVSWDTTRDFHNRTDKGAQFLYIRQV